MPFRTLNILNIKFSIDETWPPNWDPRDPLLITTYIHQTQVHRVYIHNSSSTYILYEHCFRQLLTSWKEGVKPVQTVTHLLEGKTQAPTGRSLIGLMGNSLWPLGTIHLPLTLVSHDGSDKITDAPPNRAQHLAWATDAFSRCMSYHQKSMVLSSLAHALVKGRLLNRKAHHSPRANNLNRCQPIERRKTKVSIPLEESLQGLRMATYRYDRSDREFIEHNLNIITGNTPIKQKKGKASDRSKAINV
uniref:Uncharacterized protein n=1 Tax=Lactuca sativa TaxID=4236 RepID=A0A9R1WL57_LACSA|nr:hypothetical protein LSAT_V11C100012720 [Lactuca sativa]